MSLETCENGLLFDQEMALTDGIHNYCVYNWRVECGSRPANNTPESSPGKIVQQSPKKGNDLLICYRKGGHCLATPQHLYPLLQLLCSGLFLNCNVILGCEYKFGLFPIDEGCHSSYIKCEHGKSTEVNFSIKETINNETFNLNHIKTLRQ